MTEKQYAKMTEDELGMVLRDVCSQTFARCEESKFLATVKLTPLTDAGENMLNPSQEVGASFLVEKDKGKENDEPTGG